MQSSTAPLPRRNHDYESLGIEMRVIERKGMKWSRKRRKRKMCVGDEEEEEKEEESRQIRR